MGNYKILTIKEVAALVGVTYKTLHRWDREGILPSLRVTNGSYPHNTNYQMKFYAGFFGGKMDPDIDALSPTLGWAITQEGKSPMGVEQSEEALGKIVS